MSSLHVNRIKKRLLSEFKGIIDLSDTKAKDDVKEDDKFLSRALAAFAISVETSADKETSADSVTDGYKDNGLDAILVDKESQTLYLVQSKWVKSGQASPPKGEVMKFIKGVDDILHPRFENFNKKIKAKKKEILSSLESMEYKIKLVLVYTGSQPVSQEVKKLLDDKIAELNDGGYETFSYRILNQRDLYNSLLSGTQGEPINLEKISLSNWGKHEQPYEAIYGEIEADEIAILWTKHGDKILAKNLRKFQGSTTVNSQIRLTLSKRPSDFWYFNNGITVLCKGISKGPLHGSNRSTGIFSFKDISVVNGAQTVGSIGEVSKSFPEEVKNAKVQIRFINLEDAPEDYAKEITKFNNTQNKIESKDFAALDPNQDRLRNELFLDQKRYVYKSGDSKPKRDEGCDIEEATTALACSHPNVELTIQVQREIGRIWEDIDKHPYKSIFNEKVSGVKLWRTVQIARMVEDYLSDYIIFNSDFDRLLAIHGGKLILNKVFKLYGYHKLESRNPDFEIDKGEIITSTERIYEILAQSVNQLYPKVYLNSLFKNKTKTLRLSESIDNSLGISRNLFS